ncbi:hypothetical protein ABZW18_31565 [Streptomyces sp. NPDC004647]|uniref:hypothetical protein n=1 Tax=Streptomyces sp. NPDC004647 TaxID=3154671 RepID=UPI0033B719A4
MPTPHNTPGEPPESARANLRAHLITGTEEGMRRAEELIGACDVQVLRQAEARIAALPQDYELDPGRGDARELLRRMAAEAEQDTHADS